MSVKGFLPGTRVQQPRGMWQSLKNRRSGTPARGSDAQNVRFRFGTARTRPGTSAVFATQGKVPGMFNWIAPDETNYLLYQDGLAIKAYKQADGSIVQLLVTPTTTRAPSFSPLDVWTYIAGFDTSSNGTMQVRIFDGVNVDTAFRAAPVITGWTAVDAGAGQCTQGQHFLGFVYQNRTGYTGAPITGINFPITATEGATFAVTATSNAAPDVLTVPGHAFVNGDLTTGAGATGDTAINGVFLVANVSGATLQLTDLGGNPIVGNGAYTGGGQLIKADLITAPGNNLITGQQVQIAGSTGDTAINGTRIVTVVTSGSTFYTTDTQGSPVNNNGAYAGGGILTNPIQITLTAGLRQVNISVSLPALADGGTSATGGVQATLFLIATRDGSPTNWYFIPTDAIAQQIGEQPVPLNTPVTLNFVFNFSDGTITSQLAGDTANANFFFLQQAADGTGPITPSFVVAYGNRMCYGAGTTLYVSDIQAPQQIANDTNQVRMQNQRKVGFAFALQTNPGLYLTGDRWTGMVTDNSDSPSTWAQPIQVNNELGAPYPNCVCLGSGGAWAWIVTEGGPYLFDGSYGLNPLTYLISGQDEVGAPIGWKRVNWAAAYAITVVDDVKNLKLYVAAPLDGATEPNYVFVIDYRLGKTFETVDISLDLYTPQFFSSLAVVKEITTDQTNVWFGPMAGGKVTRFDLGTHNDQGAAIDNFWTSGLARGPNITTPMIRVGAVNVWARGNAPLDSSGNPTYLITLFGPDGQQSFPVYIETLQGVAAALTEQPGLTYQSKLDASKLEDYYIQFRTNAIDSYFELSGFLALERADLINR